VSGFIVARYGQDGALDPTFGTGGVASFSFGGASCGASAAARQPDGKIIAVGSTSDGTQTDSVLVRVWP
jgi:hypothetical protein